MYIPSYITAIVVTGAVAIATAIWSILALAAQRSELPAGAASRIRIGSGVFLGAWLCVVLFFSPPVVPVSPPGVFDLQSAIPFVFAGAVGVFTLLVASSRSLRRTLGAIPLPVLHAVQVWRVLGVVFLVLSAQDRLPAHFALPAGWGDIFVGLTAPLVAIALSRRAPAARSFAVAWNVLGLLDLFVAVGMGSGLLAALLMPGEGTVPPAAAMGALPMILVPAFAVPVSVIIHVLALRRLLQWTTESPALATFDRVYSSQ